MTRSQLINTLIEHYGYKTYLEIGVNTPAQPGWNFDSVKINLKHGVDPNEKVNADFKMTSDEFFEKRVNMKYDMIFIDGLHLFEQVYKDIINSLRWLNENGTIVIHDTNPLLEKTQRRSHMPGPWHGDVWKAILKLRMEEPEISIYTVDTDEGCTVIQKGSQKLFKAENNEVDVYNFTFLNSHRKNILNLITVRDFKKIMGVNNPIKEKLKYLKKKYYRGKIKEIYRKIKSSVGKWKK